MSEESIKVINLFTRQQVVAATDEVGKAVVVVIDEASLELAKHVIKMIAAGDLVGLAIIGVNPKLDVPVLAATDSLPRLYQETLRLFAIDLMKEGITDQIHERIEFRDSETLDESKTTSEESKDTPEEPVPS
jgi:hypothetical protein